MNILKTDIFAAKELISDMGGGGSFTIKPFNYRNRRAPLREVKNKPMDNSSEALFLVVCNPSMNKL